MVSSNSIYECYRQTGIESIAFQCGISSLEDLASVFGYFGFDGWIFRGQENSSWGLSTNLEREVAIRYPKGGRKYTLADERDVLRRFRMLCPEHSSGNDIQDLALIQHYGGKTRLLDFTFSFYVALLFAYMNRHRLCKRAVWAIRFDKLFDGGTLNQSDSESSHELHLIPQRASCHFDVNNEWLRQFLCERANEVIRRGRMENETEGVLPVLLRGNIDGIGNARLQAQQGIFLMPMTFGSFESNLASALEIGCKEFSDLVELPRLDLLANLGRKDDIHLIKFVFDENFESSAFSMLNEQGCSFSWIYPDLEGSCIESFRGWL